MSNNENRPAAHAKPPRWPPTLAWVALVAIVAALFVVGLPLSYGQLANSCERVDECIFFQLPDASARAMAQLGIGLELYSWYLHALVVVGALAFSTASAVIFLLRAQSRMALFVSFTLVLAAPSTFFTVGEAAVVAHPLWQIPVRLMHAAAIWCFLVFSYTFPNGRFVPRWTRYVTWLAAPVLTVLFLLHPISELNAPSTPAERWMAVALFAFIGSSVGFQVHRYRHHATKIERQQMKWVASGFASFVAVSIAFIVVLILSPALREPGLLYGVYYLVGGTLVIFVLIVFVLSFAVAVLRYRLWDIDVIIRRTLLYTALTVTLGLGYVASVILLQWLFRPFVGQGSQVAIVVSTLLIAASFTPVRHRIQDVIDRRFFRRKYDAVKTLEAFSVTARDEVDLDVLISSLVGVVSETMQPVGISLWLASSRAEEANSRRAHPRLPKFKDGSGYSRKYSVPQ